jgi:hypothetical protein
MILCTIAKIVGLINITYSGMFGYALIFYGIAEVYNSINTHKKIKLLAATISFFIGIYLFLINNFILFDITNLFLPLVSFTISAAFFIYFLDDFETPSEESSTTTNKGLLTYLVISFIFFAIGIIMVLFSGSEEKENFFLSIKSVAVSFWPIILITIGIILLIRKR